MHIFDKAIMVENIRRYAKDKGIRIGNIETMAGVSAGYFSRIDGKDKNSITPSIETIVKVADLLCVNIEDLLYSKDEYQTPNEKKALDFINTLIKRTQLYQIDWVKEKREDIVSCDRDTGNTKHPLARSYIKEDNPSDYFGNNNYEPYYKSQFIRDKNYIVVLEGDGYKCEITNTASAYIEKVGVDEKLPFDGEIEYELYIMTTNEITPLCHSGKGQLEDICYKLERLYNLAAEANSHIILNDDVKKAMDEFMYGI